MKIHLVGTKSHAYGSTDRRTDRPTGRQADMTNLIVNQMEIMYKRLCSEHNYIVT